MRILCNWKPRVLQCLADIPVSAQADFDYVDEDSAYCPRFVFYRGAWYDTHDTQRIEPDSERVHRMGWAVRVHPGSPVARFDSVISDSAFSGVLFRFIDDDSVVVGRFYS